LERSKDHKMKKWSLDIITSALNEEDCLSELYDRIVAVMTEHSAYEWRFIICDNGSIDRTWEIIRQLAKKDSRVTGVRMSRTFTLDSAFTLGLDMAVADAAIIMASDLQDPPEVIHDFLKKYEDGYEQVVAKIIKRDSVPFIRRHMSNLFYVIANKATNNMIPRGVSDFRLLNRRAYQAAQSMKESNRFLRGLIAWTGFETAVIEIERPERFAGDSKFVDIKIRKVLNWAIAAILSHTSAPLVWLSIFGFIMSAISFLATIVMSGFWIFQGVPFAGYGSIVGLISLGFSLLLLAIGIIAQYLALIYEEVKGRPIYIVAERTDE
jgi:glycosyltransferase involved in cell wall biosynthesis